MSLTAIVPDLGDVPSQFHELYTERNGQFEMTGVEGMKTQGDVDRLQEALRKERINSGDLRTRVSAFGENTPETIEELQSNLDETRIQLEAAGREGGPSPEDIDKMAESRVLARIKPLERQMKKQEAALLEITGERDVLKVDRNRSTLVSAVERAAQAKDIGVQKDVIASGDIAAWGERHFEVVDGLVVTRDVNGLTPGLSPEQAFQDIKEGNSRSYWFGPTVGAGASGGKGGADETGDNPFAINEATGRPKNLTLAGQIMTSDPQRAMRLFKSAKGAEKFFPTLARV